MRYLEKLLEGVEVEWRPLGEVAELKRGKTITAKNKIDGDIPVISGGQKPAYYNAEYNIEGETITIAGSGAYAGYVSYWNEPIFVSDAFSVKPNLSILSIRYVFHFFLKHQTWIYDLKRGVGVPHVYPKDLAKLIIPIPPLKVQKEIVRILDTFTELTAELTSELTSELTARKKQYNYYRDQLLSFQEEEVEWKNLQEVIIKSYSGSTPKAGDPKYYDNGTIPWLRTQEVKFFDIENTEIKITDLAVTDTGAKWIPTNCVIIAISGATAGRCAINKIPLTTNQHCLCLEINPQKALYRYVFHWICLNYENIKGLGQGARGDLNSGIIKKYKIPIPSLEEQARIVSILDKFDTLTNSISEGLPKEIELRKKQYEYYRDMLLTFPRNN